MDKLLSSILEYSELCHRSDLAQDVLHECRRRLIDVMACGLAAFNEPSTVISRKLAARFGSKSDALFSNVLGASLNVPLEVAAFTNALGIRYFDGADTYPGGGGHPSDCWAGLVAVAQEVDANVQTLFKAASLAYDVYHVLFKSSNLRDKGIDNAFYVTVSTAVGASFLLGLSRESFAHAVSLSVVPNVTLGVARTGQLSMWKAGASANASRNGVFAAMLAKEGMTAPELPFSGERGLFQLSGVFDLDFGKDQPRPRIFEAHMKSYLCDYHSQTAISAAIKLHAKVDPAEIKKICISTYWFAWNEVASDPSKWQPSNRETADHSLPWIVSGVLLDGVFGEALFTPERFNDPLIRDLCSRVEVNEDAELTGLFPNRMPCRIRIFLKNNAIVEEYVDLPNGHPDFPILDMDLNDKFLTLATQTVPKTQANDVLKHLWSMDLTQSCRKLFDGCLVT